MLPNITFQKRRFTCSAAHKKTAERVETSVTLTNTKWYNIIVPFSRLLSKIASVRETSPWFHTKPSDNSSSAAVRPISFYPLQDPRNTLLTGSGMVPWPWSFICSLRIKENLNGHAVAFKIGLFWELRKSKLLNLWTMRRPVYKIELLPPNWFSSFSRRRVGLKLVSSFKVSQVDFSHTGSPCLCTTTLNLPLQCSCFCWFTVLAEYQNLFHWSSSSGS